MRPILKGCSDNQCPVERTLREELPVALTGAHTRGDMRDLVSKHTHFRRPMLCRAVAQALRVEDIPDKLAAVLTITGVQCEASWRLIK